MGQVTQGHIYLLHFVSIGDKQIKQATTSGLGLNLVVWYMSSFIVRTPDQVEMLSSPTSAARRWVEDILSLPFVTWKCIRLLFAIFHDDDFSYSYLKYRNLDIPNPPLTWNLKLCRAFDEVPVLKMSKPGLEVRFLNLCRPFDEVPVFWIFRLYHSNYATVF